MDNFVFLIIVLLIIFIGGLSLMVGIRDFNNLQKFDCNNQQAHIPTITMYGCEYSVMYCDENNTLQYDVYLRKDINNSVDCGKRVTYIG